MVACRKAYKLSVWNKPGKCHQEQVAIHFQERSNDPIYYSLKHRHIFGKNWFVQNSKFAQPSFVSKATPPLEDFQGREFLI